MVAACCALTPAFGRDRPGTPNREHAFDCGAKNKPPMICAEFWNTAKEPVTFEIEATVEGRPVDPRALGLQCRAYQGIGRATHECNVPLRSAARGRTGEPQYLQKKNDFGGGRTIQLGAYRQEGMMFDRVVAHANHCFRFRARRADNKVVSERWSQWTCARSGAPPALRLPSPGYSPAR